MDLIEDNLIDPILHWYYKYKYAQILNCITKYQPRFRTVSDIGAGSAVYSKKMSKDFPHVLFNLVDRNYSEKQISKSSFRMKYSKNITRADVFLLNDILEHIEHPNLFFKSVCNEGYDSDLVIITVPAFMALWSGHDVYLNHFRRYTKKSLLKELEDAPIEIIDVKYLFQTLFVPIYIYRKIFGKKIKSQLAMNNFFISKIISFLLKIESTMKFKFPFGVSLLLVCKIRK